MDKKKVFAILNIAETKDKNEIKAAYREKLVHVNPEDDPDGFKQLRTAYEEALRLAETEDNEEEKEEEKGEASDTPVGRWVEKIKNIYHHRSLRTDVKVWEEIFKDEVCKDFDTSMTARDALLTFLMDHYRLPKEVWELILQTFDLCRIKEELYESFPVAFIDFVTEDPENKAWINLNLFEGEDTADIDTFIDKYLSVRNLFESQEDAKIKELIKEMEEMDLYHPYLDAEKIRYYLFTNQLEVAEKLAEKLRSKQYDDVYLRYALAYTSLKLGDLERTYQECKVILEKDKNHYGTRYILACYYLEKGEYEKAKEEYLNLLEIDYNDQAANSGLQKTNEKLMEIYKEQLKEEPSNKELKMKLGWCLFQNELYEEGLALIKDMTIHEESENELYYDYHNLIGRIYFKVQDYHNAYAHVKIWLSEILKVRESERPEDQKKLKRLSHAYYAMAECLYNLTKEKEDNQTVLDKKEGQDIQETFEEIICYIDLAIETEKQNGDPMTYLAIKAFYLLKMERYKQCVDLCDEIIKLDKQYFPAYVYRQESYYHLKMAQEVIDDYYRATDIFPGFAKPYVLAAKVFIIYEQYEEAKNVFKRAEEAGIESSELKFQKLRLRIKENEDLNVKRKVIQDIETLYMEVKDNPGDIEDPSALLYEIASCYLDTEDYDRALKAIEMKIKEKPDSSSLMLKADILRNLGRYEQAISTYEQLISDDDYYISCCFQIGNCYKNAGVDEAAENYYMKVLKADPQHKFVHDKLMEIYQKRYTDTFNEEDYKKAVQYGIRQTEIYPHPYFYNGLGLVYIDGYDLDKALEMFREAIKCDEKDMYAYNNMGYVYKILGNMEEAFKYYQLAINYQTDGNLLPYRRLADYYRITKQYEKAIETYQLIKRLSQNPKSVDKELAELYEEMEDWDGAIRCYTDLYSSHEIDEMKYLLNIGYVCCFTDPDKGLRFYNRAKGKYFTNPEPYYYMGEYMLCIKEDLKKAVKYYEKAYKIIKKYNLDYYEYIDHIQFGLLYALKRLGNQKEITKYVEEFEAFLISNYGSIEGWLKDPSSRKLRLSQLAELRYFMGDYEKAKDYISRMKDTLNCSYCSYSDCIEYHFVLGLLLEAEGKELQALEAFEKVVKLGPDYLTHQYMVRYMRKKVYHT